MPRYHFNVRDGIKIDDLSGIELPTPADARLKALRLSEDILHKNAGESWIDEDWRMVVTNDKQLVLFVLQISALTPSILPVKAARP